MESLSGFLVLVVSSSFSLFLPDYGDEREVGDEGVGQEVQEPGQDDGDGGGQRPGDGGADDAEAAHQHGHRREQRGEVAVHLRVSGWGGK